MKAMTRRQSRAQETFDEYRRFSEAYQCTFREWLDIRKTDWYARIKRGEHIPQFWGEGYEG